MKQFVLPVLMWMILLKVALVTVYLTGLPFGLSDNSAGIPENQTVAVSVSVEPMVSPLDSLMATANAADKAETNEIDKTDGVRETVAENAAAPGQTAAQMDAEKERLTARKKYLERQEARLLALKEEITQKIEELTLLREEILATLGQKTEAQEAEVKHLIKIYSTMKPQKVAQLIEQLDIDLVTALFSRMKGDVVGDILSFVDSETGARITRGLFPDQPVETGMP
jgi:flagellar motility protein MotE (MotC chaperone)